MKQVCLSSAVQSTPLMQRAVQSQSAPCFELFRTTALKWADHEAVWSRERCFSWKASLDMVCRYAAYFRSHGVQPGQFVAFYLTNSPEFLFCWLALLAIGAAPALVNYHLAGEALVRCVEVSGASLLLVDDDEGCSRRVAETTRQMAEIRVQTVVLDHLLRTSIEALPSSIPTPPEVRAQASIGLMYTRYGATSVSASAAS